MVSIQGSRNFPDLYKFWSLSLQAPLPQLLIYWIYSYKKTFSVVRRNFHYPSIAAKSTMSKKNLHLRRIYSPWRCTCRCSGTGTDRSCTWCPDKARLDLAFRLCWFRPRLPGPIYGRPQSDHLNHCYRTDRLRGRDPSSNHGPVTDQLVEL